MRDGAVVDAGVVFSARCQIQVLDALPNDREDDSGSAPDVTPSKPLTIPTLPGCANANEHMTAT